MADAWYPPTRTCPGIAVPVIVHWNGRDFRAARWANTSGYQGWVTFENGQRQNLPPAGEESLWGVEPEAWRPERPELWKAELPPPMISCEPRMWSSRTKFQAVEEASAADLAREMEADRADAHRNAREAGAAAGRAQMLVRQWWRDGTLITYAPAGSITKREAEGRIMRALAWCGAGAGLTLKERTPLTIIAQISDFMDGADERDVARFEPLPQDVRDFDVAMDWFTRLYPVELRSKHHDAWTFNDVQRILLWRAKAVPLSFSQIGRHLGVSEQRAIQKYTGGARQAGAIDRIWRAANGFKVYEHVTAKDQIAALRQRNRSHRIAQA